MTEVRAVLEGKEELERKLAALSKAAATAIAKDAVDEGAGAVQFYAQQNALSVFSDRQRGTLRGSIYPESWSTDTGAEAKIGPHVIYGRVQELGGTIRPIKAKTLKFQIDGQWRSAKQVTLSARPYLGPSVEDHKEQIISVMKEAVADGIMQSV